MSTVYYTNVYIPMSGSGGPVNISGSFSMNYDGSGGATFNAVNLTSSDGVIFNTIEPVWSLSHLSGYGPNTFQFQLRHADSLGEYGLNITYEFTNLDGSQISILEDSAGTSDTYYFYDSFDHQISDTSSYSSGVAAVDGSLIDPACYVRGTFITTCNGKSKIQDLKIGDLVINHQGQKVAIKWIGKQRVHPAFGKHYLPICIKAGALGGGLPVRNLFVSPNHSMYIENCLLVHAKALVNDRSIFQVREWLGDIEYFHIETEKHEIILAEGAPTETFIDNISRRVFYNHSEYEALYPDAKPMVQLDIPRVKYARQLPMAIKKLLDDASSINSVERSLAKSA